MKALEPEMAEFEENEFDKQMEPFKMKIFEMDAYENKWKSTKLK
jgi:hypothetical protein